MRALLVLGLLWAGRPAPAASPSAFKSFELPNGLRVILAPDPAVPVVTVAMMFDAGSRQESRGRSGFAHLFEHLMFQGSAHVPKGSFDKILEGYGAENNASTHEDFTFFYEVLPSHVLPVVLWLDADRLSALDVSQENMLNQVSVVEEEKRMRVDNQPYQPMLWVEVASRTFSNWTNAHPTIGTFADLDAATLKDVRAFFTTYYAPKNGALAVVGDFEPERARRLIEKYFAWIPNKGSPAPVDSSEPEQREARFFALSDPNAKLPAVAIAFNNMPQRRSRDYYALTLLGRLLFEGKSARLYQLLVKELQVATSVEGGLGFPISDWEEYKAPGLLGGFILQKSTVTAERVRDLVFAEAGRIVSEGVGKEELERVKTKFRSDWILERQKTLGRAEALLRATILDLSPTASEGELERFMAVSPEEIKAAASRYLSEQAANIFACKPAAPSKEGP